MPERSHPNNLQKRFNSVISSIEPAGGVGDARITDDDRQALGAKDGNVHSVAVEEEAEAAGAVFAVAGTEGKDAERSFLSLEPIHTAAQCAKLAGLAEEPLLLENRDSGSG